MELTYYLRIVARRWPFAVIGLLLTLALTVAFLQRQPLVYRSTATMVIRPRTVNSEDNVRAIDTLTRGVEISSTYATIARSELIRNRAKANLDPSLDTSGTKVSSEVVTSTSILEVDVTGREPEAAAALAAEVTRQTVTYVAELQNVYELQIIDEPQIPNRPVAPKRRLILGTGVFFGVGVGIVFALLAEAAARPARSRRMRYQASRRIRRRGHGGYANPLTQPFGDLEDETATPRRTDDFEAQMSSLLGGDRGRRSRGPGP